MNLDQIRPGEKCIVKVVGGQGLLRKRLLEMGLTPNTMIEVRKVAPMKDPIEVYLRSYVLTLRKEDAAKIEVERCE